MSERNRRNTDLETEPLREEDLTALGGHRSRAQQLPAVSLWLLLAILAAVTGTLVWVAMDPSSGTLRGSVVSFDGNNLTVKNAQGDVETFELGPDAQHPAIEPLDPVVIDYRQRAGRKMATRISTVQNPDDQNPDDDSESPDDDRKQSS